MSYGARRSFFHGQSAVGGRRDVPDASRQHQKVQEMKKPCEEVTYDREEKKSFEKKTVVVRRQRTYWWEALLAGAVCFSVVPASAPFLNRTETGSSSAQKKNYESIPKSRYSENNKIKDIFYVPNLKRKGDIFDLGFKGHEWYKRRLAACKL